MTARPMPPHGSEGRYKGSKTRPACKCDTCLRGRRHAQTRRALIRLHGGSSLVPRDQLMPHLTKLLDSGMSQQTIARQAGVAQTTVSYLVRGKVSSTQLANARRLLAVEPHTFDDAAWQPAYRTVRRVRALYAAGHGPETIADLAKVDVSSIPALAAARWVRVRPRVAHGIRTAYDTLAGVAGTSAKARYRARKSGWPDPTWWEDMGGLDDPDAPDHVDATDKPLTAPQLAAARAADIQHLARFGIPTHEIAARVGVTPEYVRAQLRGHRVPGQPRTRLQEAA